MVFHRLTATVYEEDIFTLLNLRNKKFLCTSRSVGLTSTIWLACTFAQGSHRRQYCVILLAPIGIGAQPGAIICGCTRTRVSVFAQA
eukprot:359849-Chlamydomonas_euryale.AAC.5